MRFAVNCAGGDGFNRKSENIREQGPGQRDPDGTLRFGLSYSCFTLQEAYLA